MILRTGLRVLMYHKISMDKSDGLTVRMDNFISQIQWLKKNGFHFVHPNELNHSQSLSKRAVLITFDDAYEMNSHTAIPYLEKERIPSVTFVPTAHVGELNSWDHGNDMLESWQNLRDYQKFPHHFLAIHCHQHKSYRNISLAEVEQDLAAAIHCFKSNQVSFLPWVAYPFGNYPKKNNQQFFKVLENASIDFAFRIGQRLNRFPFKNKFLMERIDMRGDVSERSMRMKIRFGKVI